MITENAIWLIVGLSAGCAILLVIAMIIIIVVACRRRRSKDGEVSDGQSNKGAESIELNEDSGNYCTIPEAEAEADSNANEYCAAGPTEPDNNKEYSELGPPPTENAPYYLSLLND